jgi:ATP-dependent DNA helicase DinG
MHKCSINELEETYNKVISILNKTHRPTQLQFVKNLYASFYNAPIVNFNESPTGTGKGYAYLIPSFLFLHYNPEEKIIISTKTLNLQSQLLYSDIPNIKDSMATLGIGNNIKIAVFKGRNNYVCGYRLFKEQKKNTTFDTTAMENWLDTSTGEKDDFLKMGYSYKDWKKIETKDSRECLKKLCVYYGHPYCCYNKAKINAKNANLLIVNHYLLFTDIFHRSLGVKENLIPIDLYTNIILDEAHLLEDIITSTFTYEFTKNTLIDISNRLRYNYLISDTVSENKITKSSEALSKYIKKLEGDEVFPTPELFKLITTCIEAIISYIDFLEILVNGNLFTEAKIVVRGIILQLKDIIDFFGKILQQNNKYVTWKEEDVLNLTLIDYKDLLEKYFFNEKLCLNLVSATLSYHKQFFYAMKSLYLDRILPTPKVTGDIYPSIFNAKQTKYILPVNLEDYRSEHYENQLAYIIKTLLTENKGSALILFTSLKRMNSLYDIIKKEKLPFKLLMQSNNTSKADLLAQFKLDKTSVLFGSYSFWEGIDCPGETLSLIIIDKLPFETPSTVTKAITDQFGGFYYQCFKTTIKLKQGVGRLIRNESDYGKVIICDNRLQNTSWGKQIFQNLQL